MPYNIYQTKEDWLTFRKGLFTSSQIHRLLTEPTKKELERGEQLSTGAHTYIDECVADIQAEPEPDYYSASMNHGNETEPQAVIRYAKENGLDINSEDFIYTSIGGFVFFTDAEGWSGGTPDIILKDRIVEIKCPDSKTHVKYRRMKTVEDVINVCPDYYSQMQYNMFLTERYKCDFVSFDDRFFDEKKQYICIEIPYDESHVKLIQEKVLLANKRKVELLK